MKKSIQDLFNSGLLRDSLGKAIYGVGPTSSRPGGDFVFPFDEDYVGLSYRVAEFKFGYLSDKYLSLLNQTKQCNDLGDEIKTAVASRNVPAIKLAVQNLLQATEYLIKVRDKVLDSAEWIAPNDFEQFSPERKANLAEKLNDLEVSFSEASKAIQSSSTLIGKCTSAAKLPTTEINDRVSFASFNLKSGQDELKSKIFRITDGLKPIQKGEQLQKTPAN